MSAVASGNGEEREGEAAMVRSTWRCSSVAPGAECGGGDRRERGGETTLLRFAWRSSCSSISTATSSNSCGPCSSAMPPLCPLLGSAGVVARAAKRRALRLCDECPWPNAEASADSATIAATAADRLAGRLGGAAAAFSCWRGDARELSAGGGADGVSPAFEVAGERVPPARAVEMIHTNSASVSVGVEGGCRLNLAVSNCVSMEHTAWWLIPCATTCSST